MTKEEFLVRARDTHGYKYNYPNLKEKVLSTDDIDVEYNGTLYKQKVVKHILLGRCPEKNTPSKTTEGFILEAKLLWKDKYDYSLTDYKGALKKVNIIYKGIVFEQTAVTHLQGQCCERMLNQENFILKSKEKYGEKYDYSLVKFKHGNFPVLIGYNGIFYLQRPYHHLSGYQPENRKLATRKTTRTFILESQNVHDYKYSYDKVEYITNQVKVIITCPIHGDFEQRPLSHVQGNGCANCNESRGEKAIAKYLDKNNISYYRQHKFLDCRNVFELPFDFYIPVLRTAIEFDGKQHYEPIGYFGGLQTFEKLQINDRIKSDYCEDNYIDLVRVKYTQLDNIDDYLKEVFKFKQ